MCAVPSTMPRFGAASLLGGDGGQLEERPLEFRPIQLEVDRGPWPLPTRPKRSNAGVRHRDARALGVTAALGRVRWQSDRELASPAAKSPPRPRLPAVSLSDTGRGGPPRWESGTGERPGCVPVPAKSGTGTGESPRFRTNRGRGRGSVGSVPVPGQIGTVPGTVPDCRRVPSSRTLIIVGS